MKKEELNSLNVGDRVRVKQNPRMEPYGQYDLTERMKQLAGQEGVVTNIVRNEGVKIDFGLNSPNVTWTQSMLDLVDQPTTTSEDTISHYVCIKTFPGCQYKVGQKVKLTDHPTEYFLPEYFEAVLAPTIPTMKKPALNIEGYNVEVSDDGSTINWGCRRFTREDFSAVVKAVRILNDHDLGFTTGRAVRNPIPASKLEKLEQYIEFKTTGVVQKKS